MGSKRKNVLFLFLVLCFVMTGGAFAGDQSNGPVLRLFNKQFDPVLESPQTGDGPQLNGMGAQSKSAAPQSESVYYIVQFDGKVQSAWKENLKALGVTFYDYIPEYAFIIKADASKLQDIKDAAHVRWVGEYAPEFRMSSRVYDVSPEKLKEQGSKVKLRVVAFPGEDVSAMRQKLEALGAEVASTSESSWQIMFVINIPIKNVEQIADINGVKWVEPVLKRRISNNVATDILEARSVREKVWPTKNSKLFGAGQKVAICDTGIDTGVSSTLHWDFKDGNGNSRVTISQLSSQLADTDGHGTHVAGSVLGNGARSGSDPANDSFPESCFAGLAPKAEGYFQVVGPELDGLPNDLSKLFQSAYEEGARIHTNSWGADSMGRYTTDSQIIDQFMWNKKDFLLLFAAGNSGIDKDRDGVIDKYSLDTEASAKNCLTVGASENLRASGGSQKTYGNRWPEDYRANPIFSDKMSDNTNGMVAFSSRGPTLDGRYKPEVVAPGTNILSTRSSAQGNRNGWGAYNEYYYYAGGTSMSTPLTAGAAALMREYLVEEKDIPNPSAALVKSSLIHGAVDMSPGQYGSGSTQDSRPAPDISQGWGRVNLEGVMSTDSNRTSYFVDHGGISQGFTEAFSCDVKDAAAPLRVVLGWTDHPGSLAVPGGGLVNDLDLCVKKGSQVWYPDNGLNLSELKEVAYFDEDTVDPASGIGAIGVHITAPSYPTVLESVGAIFKNWQKEEDPVTLVVYEWESGAPGTELYRKEYGYLPDWTELILPVGITVTQDIFVSIEVTNTDTGVWNDPYTGSRSLEKSGGSWVSSNRMPAISALFRDQSSATTFDRVNNTVSITIPNPVPGVYSIEVTGHDVPQGPQPYALVYSYMNGTIETSGDDSVAENPSQPNAPGVTIDDTSRQDLSEAEVEQEYGITLDDKYSDLVMFNCTVAAADQAKPMSMRYAVRGLPDNVEAGSIGLRKLLGNGGSIFFNYAGFEEYVDGNWWLTTGAGTYVAPSTLLSSGETYYVVSVIRDNGDYDINKTPLKIDDPQILTTAPSTPSSGGGGGGGGGCSTGSSSDMLLPMLLVAAVLVMIRTRRVMNS